MKTAELTELLIGLGWSVRKDEVGDRVAHILLRDRIVQIAFGIRDLGTEQQLEATLSLSTEVFSRYCSKIHARGKRYWPLVVCDNGIFRRATEIFSDHVRQMSEEAISWAKMQDLEEALRKHSLIPPNSPGARPLFHLAALAATGDIGRLKLYQSSFDAGDRLGFVDYVTRDYIDRAIKLGRNIRFYDIRQD